MLILLAIIDARIVCMSSVIFSLFIDIFQSRSLFTTSMFLVFFTYLMIAVGIRPILIMIIVNNWLRTTEVIISFKIIYLLLLASLIIYFEYLNNTILHIV